ncbi:hypothetical protein JCM24511_01675 [Saitozyma sp. JCM 24511]|nr:hypothetical protein JCM24511_01675 [Saitozyma sp. JCM 24511]
MPARLAHDADPPSHWPISVIYLTKPRLSPTFPAELVPLLLPPTPSSGTSPKFAPRPSTHPSGVMIKPITSPGHPAVGQLGLFAKKKIPGGELVIPYLGVLHASVTPFTTTDSAESTSTPDTHSSSDYDLSLLRLSAVDPRNPFHGSHISIGVDAATMGNAARFVNDFRGVAGAANAEFRVGRGEGGEMRMEVWSLKAGIGKGEEVLVSYGKGWWGARTG